MDITLTCYGLQKDASFPISLREYFVDNYIALTPDTVRF